MCEQCLVQAQIVVEDIIPGYTLMISTQDAPHWPKDYWGLVRQNNPDFTWPGPGLPADPLTGKSEDEINVYTGAASEWVEYQKFIDYCDEIECEFNTDPMTGYHFVQACIDIGFDPECDGDVVMWFIDWAAALVKAQRRMQ